MKKLTILFLLISSFAFSQGTVQVADGTNIENVKLNYKKVVILSPNEVNALLESMNQWKRLQIYDPTVSADESVKRIKSIDAFLIELQKNIKLDSVLVDPIKPKQP